MQVHKSILGDGVRKSLVFKKVAFPTLGACSSALPALAKLHHAMHQVFPSVVGKDFSITYMMSPRSHKIQTDLSNDATYLSRVQP